jgi:hypothetical protein
MTKIGEGKELPKEPSVQQYQKELDHNAMKFLNALQSYQSSDEEDRKKLKPIMDQCMALIKASVSEIKQRGIAKKEVEVEKDYKKYLQTGKQEDLSALEEDLSTLRDYGHSP